MVKILTKIKFCRGTFLKGSAWGAVFLLGVTSADALTQSDYQAITNLDSKLQQTWTKQQYINAYLHTSVLATVESGIATQENRGQPLGQYNFAWVEAMAALYSETGNTNCLNLVKRAMLQEIDHPSTNDIQFTLSRLTHTYQLVRTNLDAVLTLSQRNALESTITNHAHNCLSMESGTEMNRGILNMLGLIRSAELYPFAAEKTAWTNTAMSNWTNGFRRMKDTNEDATSYNALWIYNMMMVAEKLETNIVAFYQLPWVKDNFERYLNVRLPQGTEPMTFNHDLFIEYNMALYEWAGKIYQDGRYRWAAQRMFNILRTQPGSSNRVSREPVFLYTDDSVPVVEPQRTSYYSHRRYDREYPNKFVLRSGHGLNATALTMNLFNGGGHGRADGSSIYSLMDQYGLLLAGPAVEEASDEYGNIVLFRKAGDPFPFGAADPSAWRRVHVGLLAANSALGGLNINLSSVTTLGMRFDATNTSAGPVYIRNVAVGGENGSRILFSGETNYAAANTWMPFPGSYPQDLSGYDYLEFDWKYDPASAAVNPTAYINSTYPSASSRFRSAFLHNWRDSSVRLYGDYESVHMVAVEVSLYGCDGGKHKQYRDIFMLLNQLIWVRDTFVFGASGDYQVGPLWHVGDVKSSGTNWVQTRSYSTTIYNGSWVEAGEPRDLLIVMPQRTGFTNGVTAVNTSSESRRMQTAYQKWTGHANLGDRIVFNSILIPNQSTNPALLAAAVQMAESNNFAKLTYGAWVLVDNPDTHAVTLPDGSTTAQWMTALTTNGTGVVDHKYELGIPSGTGAIAVLPGMSSFVVSWPSQPNHIYSVLWSTNLLSGFQPLAGGIEYPQNSWTDTVHGAERTGFYLVKVEL